MAPCFLCSRPYSSQRLFCVDCDQLRGSQAPATARGESGQPGPARPCGHLNQAVVPRVSWGASPVPSTRPANRSNCAWLKRSSRGAPVRGVTVTRTAPSPAVTSSTVQRVQLSTSTVGGFARSRSVIGAAIYRARLNVSFQPGPSEPTPSGVSWCGQMGFTLSWWPPSVWLHQRGMTTASGSIVDMWVAGRPSPRIS